MLVRGYSVLGYEPSEAHVPLAEFSDAIRGFRATYAFEKGPPRVQIGSIEAKNSTKEAEDFAASCIRSRS